MSTTNKTKNAENNQSFSSDATESNNRSCTYWIREDGREFITDPNGDVVNLARLTAYAEHGAAIHGAHAHHEIPLLKIDAPAFLGALPQEEHGRLHGGDPKPVEVDGFPLLLPEGETDG